MKTEAKKFFAFMRHKQIAVFSEQKPILDKWYRQVKSGELKTIYFDSEDMWVDRTSNGIVDFNWENSKFDINRALAEQVLHLKQEGRTIQREELDFEDTLSLRYAILVEEFQGFVSQVNWKKY